MRALLAFGLMLAVPQIAWAGDWRYCLAPSEHDHKIYMTAPFPETPATGDAESQFRRTLSWSGLVYDIVQCPLSDNEPAALEAQQQAIDYNRKLGNQIVSMNWKPGK
jgi:hypothetical protein